MVGDAMFDKFLFFLSIEPFAATLIPLAMNSEVERISECARLEIIRMFEGEAGYYMIDFSSERRAHSKMELKSHLNNNLSDQMAQYISYVADFFDSEVKRKMTIKSIISARIDEVLRLDLSVPSEPAFLAVQKLHENYVFSSDIDSRAWIEQTLALYNGQWATRLQDPELFDGIEDMLTLWMYDVFNELPWCAFVGIAKNTCTDQELKALIENLEGSMSNSNEAAIKLISGLRLL